MFKQGDKVRIIGNDFENGGNRHFLDVGSTGIVMSEAEQENEIVGYVVAGIAEGQSLVQIVVSEYLEPA